jgi:hypothetical protein
MTTLTTFDDDGDLGADRTGDPTGPGGLTLPVLALAALIASPAIWQCLVLHTVTTQVMLERYVVIALGCLLVSGGARRLLRPTPATAPARPTAPADATPTDAADPAADLTPGLPGDRA